MLAGMALVLAAFAALRLRLVAGVSRAQDVDILKDPYLLAAPVEEWATKLHVLFKYAALLVFPHPLCSDYGYRAIPYRDFTSPGPWLGILVLAGLLAAGAWAVRARHWLAFAAAVSLLPLLLVSNLFFNVGGTMAERFLFLPSVGYCMALGSLLTWAGAHRASRPLAAAAALAALVLFPVKTIARNRAWEDDATLALTDVRTSPESVLLNGNATWCTLRLAERPANAPNRTRMVRDAVRFGEKAVSLNPRYVTGMLNLGLAYAKLGEYDRSRQLWEAAFRLHPQHPSRAQYLGDLANSYFNQGLDLGRQGRWVECAATLRKAVELAPENARYWRALGNCANDARDGRQAAEAWGRAGRLESRGSAPAAPRGQPR
jgi:tetratricopeptide (TPR) repeat protein